MDENLNNYEEQDVSIREGQEWSEQNAAAEYDLEPPVSVNHVGGIIGAVLGSLVGVALWIGVDMIGFIAGICGVVMLRAAMKGYKILGGRVDRFGAIFSVILSFIMIFVSVNLALIVAYISELGMDYVQGVGIPYILQFSWTDPEILRYTLINLAVGYALYLWSGFSLIKGALKGEVK